MTHFALVWDSAADFTEFENEYPSVLEKLGYSRPLRGQDQWSWAAGERDEYGVALLDSSSLRVDVIFGTELKAVEASIKALRDYASRKR
jgi:hypothetical protein